MTYDGLNAAVPIEDWTAVIEPGSLDLEPVRERRAIGIHEGRCARKIGYERLVEDVPDADCPGHAANRSV